MRRFARLLGCLSPGRSDPDARAGEPLRMLLALAAAAVHAETGDLLELVCRKLGEAYDTRYVCVHLDNPDVVDPAVAARGYVMCPTASQPPSEHARFMAAEIAHGRRARQQGACPLADCLDDSVDLQQLAEAAGFRGGLAVPLGYQREILGTINIYTEERQPAIDPQLVASVGAVLYGALKKQAFVAVLERVRGTLERYLAPELVEKIVREPEALATRTTLSEVTVVFSDIRGFTGLAEKNPPDVVSEMLSEHLAAMAEAVFVHGGMVDKYLGDAVMAVFGAPFPQPDHAHRAFITALEMQARQRELSARWQGRLRRAIEIGVGIHTGPVTVGDVGHARRAEYAVVGDTVNVASRLKDLAGAGEILVSDAVVAAAGDGFSLRSRSTLAIRGRSRPVATYQLVGTDQPTTTHPLVRT